VRSGKGLLAAAAAIVGVAFAGGSAPAGAAGSATAQRGSPALADASLSQDGQQVTWSVEAAGRLSATGLAQDERSVCLLLEPDSSSEAAAELCIEPPGRHERQLWLGYVPTARAGAAPVRVTSATITRAGSRQLTATFLPASVGLDYRPLDWQVISRQGPPACVPTAATPGCESVYPARPQRLALHTPVPVGCVASGPSWVFNGPTDKREIALTFDDGPWSDTQQFLDILEREHVEATFFEIGRQIPTYGEGGAIERRMLADGDMIGDHTWSHPDLAAGGTLAEQQISETANEVRRVSGFTPCLFRAPYGDVSPALLSVARSLGFLTIQWDIDPSDWALPGVSAIYDNVIANAHNGAIIIQHDGGGNRSETLAALPEEIDTLRQRGYQFVTITEMLGLSVIYK
jgi:peptidoglycan/xylan/chitin deacetylase (PgdA/CDA1 family)